MPEIDRSVPALAREGHEPTEAHHRMPILMALVTGAIGAWGATYLWFTAADGTAGMYGDQRTHSALQGEPPGDADAAAAARSGEQVYTSLCSACHQSSGAGLSGAFPPLAASEWVSGPPERIAAIVLYGLQGEIVVKGETYSGVMPPFGSQLSDEEIANVLTHIRSSFGNNADAVDAALVTEVRTAQGSRGPMGGGAELTSAYP